MTQHEIEHALRDIAQRELGTSPEAIEERIETLDSLERMQLAMAVEDHFHILLKPTDEAELCSLDDLVVLVAQKLVEEDRRAG